MKICSELFALELSAKYLNSRWHSPKEGVKTIEVRNSKNEIVDTYIIAPFLDGYKAIEIGLPFQIKPEPEIHLYFHDEIENKHTMISSYIPNN